MRTGEYMNTISISEAIKMVNVSRSHFYKKYVGTGLISIIVENNKKLIDVSELIRVFGRIQLENNFSGQEKTTEDNLNTHEKDKVIQILEQQLQELKGRELASLEREKWLQSQIDTLNRQNGNLLENKFKPSRKKLFGIF